MVSHLAFIMDGNRRYGKKEELEKEAAYKEGLNTLLEMIYEQVNQGIKETSFFALSEDNFHKRTSEDRKTIKNVMEEFLNSKEVEDFFVNNKIRLREKGNIEELKKQYDDKSTKDISELLKEKAERIDEKISNPQFYVNIALNYDGQQEIVEAVKEISTLAKKEEIDLLQIDKDLLKENIFFNSSPSPEIIVRTGDAPRISGFMLWDSKYSELYLTEKLWPELGKEDFNAILDWYKNIERNFGQ